MLIASTVLTDRPHLGGVGMMATVSGRVTVDFLGERSPRAGALTTVNLTCIRQIAPADETCSGLGEPGGADQLSASHRTERRAP
jgi:hypothetical protein